MCAMTGGWRMQGQWSFEGFMENNEGVNDEMLTSESLPADGSQFEL